MSEEIYQSNSGIPVRVDNYLVWSILVTVLCCLPMGIYAIILSTKVDPLVAAGQIEEAKAMAAKARKWCIYSAVAWAVVMVLYVLFFVVLGVATSRG